VEDIEEMRRIYNLKLSDDIPKEIRCRGCGEPKQLVRVNDRVAFWAHMDRKIHEACKTKLTFRTSFIQDVAAMWGHWAKAQAMMNESDYASHWQIAYAENAGKFLRNEFELGKKDRRWLYENLEGPVVDLACGNAIDYDGFTKYSKQYMGVDVTPAFIEAAVKEHGVPPECLTLSDARKTPFKDKQFKSGYLKDVLLHYRQEDGYAFIDELLRVAENAYIAWGYLGEVSFMPSEYPKEEKWADSFYYNIYDIRELEKRYRITAIGDDTTIMRIEKH